MKHILIFLSILLLSSPLFGKETGVLFFRYGNEDVGWYEDDDGSKSGKYLGDIENGFPNGHGTFTFADNGRQYIGELKDGKPHGQGTFTHTDGGKYEGGYKDGFQHGHGIFNFADGKRKYVGEYKNGILHGKGTLTFPDGKTVGEFRDNKPWNITEYDKDGNINRKMLKGKWIKP